MNLQDAKTVGVGDLLEGAGVGVNKPTKVLEIRHTSDLPDARLPLFVLEGERFPITYSLLNKVGERND